MLCQECPAISFCQSACPELSLHLKEIEKPQREKPIGFPCYGRMPLPKREIKLTKREQQIVTLLAAGKRAPQMSKILDITQENVRTFIKKIRHKLVTV